MDKDAVTPGPVTPAREMLAQMLLLEKHPRESLAQYETVLNVAPNRFNALYGAASAADASGNTSTANQYFEKLTKIASGDERPESIAVRKRVADATMNALPSRP